MKTRRRVIKRNNVKTIKKGGAGLSKVDCYKWADERQKDTKPNTLSLRRLYRLFTVSGKSKSPTVSGKSMSPTFSGKSKFHKLCDDITSSTKTLSPTKKARNLDNLLHLYFNDNSFREEIFKSMKNPNFCFLHEIRLTNSDTSIRTHSGKKSFARTQFDPVKYRNEQIDPCKSNIMAIPIIITMVTPTNTITPGSGHSNVLIIQKHDSNQTLEAELFEPHGKKRPTQYEMEDIQFRNLLEVLFPEYTINFIPPVDLCPEIKGLQGRVKSGNWSGTCTMFTMWYAFLRLLSPSTSREDIYAYMFEVFEKESPENVIEYITTAFTDLVKININEGTVNGRVIPMSQTPNFKKKLGKNNEKRLLTAYYEGLKNNTLSTPTPTLPLPLPLPHLQ